MARKERDYYTWFLEPKDAETNAVIAKNCAEEDFLSEVLCDDGERHNLWRCTRQLRDAIVASKKGMCLSFEVFCKEGGGKIRNVSFLFRKRGSQKAQHLLKQAGKKRP